MNPARKSRTTSNIVSTDIVVLSVVKNKGHSRGRALSPSDVLRFNAADPRLHRGRRTAASPV
jgi:hypothetical protein